MLKGSNPPPVRTLLIMITVAFVCISALGYIVYKHKKFEADPGPNYMEMQVCISGEEIAKNDSIFPFWVRGYNAINQLKISRGDRCSNRVLIRIPDTREVVLVEIKPEDVILQEIEVMFYHATFAVEIFPLSQNNPIHAIILYGKDAVAQELKF